MTSMAGASSSSFRPSNDVLLQRLLDGTANFELLSNHVSPSNLVPSISAFSFPTAGSSPAFARIGPPLLDITNIYVQIKGGGGAMRKLERYSVQKVTGDGRCMFRALAKGMAVNKGIILNMRQETADADELRLAVKEVICENEEERCKYEEALIAITVEESLKRYCHRIGRSDFWGGEAELLVLSKLCHQPIIVYIPEHEHTRAGWGTGFIPIAEYGAEFSKAKKSEMARTPVRLLYSGKNHYDLLV